MTDAYQKEIYGNFSHYIGLLNKKALYKSVF